MRLLVLVLCVAQVRGVLQSSCKWIFRAINITAQYSYTATLFAAKNKISLTCGDGRQFVMGVQLARRRSLSEVKRMMHPPLELQQAIKRITDQVGL